MRAQRLQPLSIIRRILERWPYACIAISVVGLVYIAVGPAR